MTGLIAENVKKLNDALLDLKIRESDFVEIITENIPEWQRLMGSKQHDIHDYTLDVHTLLVFKKIRESQNFLNLNEYEQLILLYAAILHDIEKQEHQIDPSHPERGAVKSSAILYRLGFSEDFINRVYILIKYHQVLGLMASGRICILPEKLASIYNDASLIELQKILAIADIKSVKKDESFFNENMDARIHELVDEVKKLLV